MKAVQSSVINLGGKKKAKEGKQPFSVSTQNQHGQCFYFACISPNSEHKVYRTTSSMHEEQANKELYSFHIKCIIDHSYVIF